VITLYIYNIFIIDRYLIWYGLNIGYIGAYINIYKCTIPILKCKSTKDVI